MPRSDSLKKLRSLKMTTPQGRRMQRAALQFLETMQTREDAHEMLKAVGIYREDGTPNPYFHPAEDERPGKDENPAAGNR